MSRHMANILRRRTDLHIPMDQGGWVKLDELAWRLNVAADFVVAVARYAAKYQDKAHFQVAYDEVLDEYHDRDEKKAKDNNEKWSPQRWANEKALPYVAIRACQGHFDPEIVDDRIIKRLTVVDLPMIELLVHATDEKALPEILVWGLIPGGG